MPACPILALLRPVAWVVVAGLPISAASAEIASTPVPAAELQDFVHGVVRQAVRFREGEQTLTLVLSETGRHGDGDEGESAGLYATLLEATDGEYGQRWRIADYVTDCPLDLTLRYTQPAFHLRDADRDGLVEVWVSYRLACRGDVSPTALKLIGYEGTQKLAMRGSSILQYEIDGVLQSDSGPPPSVDAALAAAPALRAEAAALWQRIARESLD